MPVFLAALAGAFINIAGTLAGRVLLSLGFGIVAYTGLNSTLSWLKTQAVSALSGLPAQALGMLATMKVGECISIIFSAILVRQILNGLTSDTLKRLVQR